MSGTLSIGRIDETGIGPVCVDIVLVEANKVVAEAYGTTKEKAIHNANLIVARNNAHAGLVEALRDILHDHATCVASGQPGFLTDKQVEKASAAFAAAKEGKPV